MAKKYNLFSAIKRAVTSILRLTPKTKTPRPATRTKRPKTPKIKPETPKIAPAIPSEYQKIIEELRRENEQLKQQIETLTKEPALEPQTEAAPVYSEDDLPYLIEDDIPAQSFDFSEDDLPYLVEDDTEKEPIDTTYKNFGSDDSLDVLIDFIGNSALSGVPEGSEFFNLSPIEQKFMLLDYVQFQHDANPALFYKGKKALSLENVPIWGDEFERFVTNTTNFNGITSDDAGNINDDFVDYLIDTL